MVLPDPTPREPDLEKRFKINPSAAVTDPARMAAYNRQRLQLIGQAATHMHLLATMLQTSVAERQEQTNRSQEALVAGAIETLAANVYAAMLVPKAASAGKAEQDPGPATTANGTEATPVSADAGKLVALTEALEEAVSKSTADTLAVGVLIKSAEVRAAAHNLKLRLQPQQTSHQ